jgi:aldehyde dehydrogenase (NAD+)
MEDIKETIGAMRAYFLSGATLEKTWRITQLRTLQACLKANETELLDALSADLGKSSFESYATELGMVYGEITEALSHLSTWMKPHKVPGSLVNFPSRNYTIAEPLGVTLVMSPWNYPVQLSLAPVVAAFAAGDPVVLKPSRYSANTSGVLKRLLDTAFDKRVISTFLGGSEMNTLLLEERFDFIFFTGSTKVGKVVMRSASEYLTPVVLELGGKSPAIIDRSADLKMAARRLAWGKCLNAGQTCVAPDHVLVDRSIMKEFIALYGKEVNAMFGNDPLRGADFPHIINEKHYERLKALLEDGAIAFGGTYDDEEKKISPTVMTDIKQNSPLMTDEIFGPILPVIPYDDFDETIDSLKEKEHPLALYLFTTDGKRMKSIPRSVPYGGGCVNDCVMHLANPHMAFGGFGMSGMGKYHGKDGFETFSHRKSILVKGNHFDVPLRYAPFGKKLGLAQKLMK